MILSRTAVPTEETAWILDRILGKWAIYRSQHPDGYRSTPMYRYELWQREEGKKLLRVASWRLEQFPGNKQVGISTHMKVEEAWRNKGIASALMSAKRRFARELGYKVLMCTVLPDNYQELAVLQHTGWLYRFSLATENTAALWSVTL